jgi:hypothetical protein
VVAHEPAFLKAMNEMHDLGARAPGMSGDAPTASDRLYPLRPENRTARATSRKLAKLIPVQGAVALVKGPRLLVDGSCACSTLVQILSMKYSPPRLRINFDIDREGSERSLKLNLKM